LVEVSPQLKNNCAGVATVAKLTVKLNVVVLLTPPPVAVTVMLELPAGVELLVLMVIVDEQLGLQLVEEKEAAAPAGKPEAEKVTA
jgi:predicted lysophospholipase L1 biosynthesis ABC-type transport system permease subunit